MKKFRRLGVLVAFLTLTACTDSEESQVPQTQSNAGASHNRILNLYDAFCNETGNAKFDFGFFALIEYNGQTILFDSGTDAEIFKDNVQAFGVDLRKVDFAVGSHSHADWPEISLALDTPEGQVLIVGCSHSTVEAIVRETKDYSNKKIKMVMGGYHLIPYKTDELLGMAKRLKRELEVERIAPAHCTGHLAFKVLSEAYASDFIPAGLGSQIPF